MGGIGTQLGEGARRVAAGGVELTVRSTDGACGLGPSRGRDGYLVQEEEAIPGLSSLAAPIRELGGAAIAALNVAEPSTQYDRERLVAARRDPVLQVAQTISRRLGG